MKTLNKSLMVIGCILIAACHSQKDTAAQPQKPKTPDVVQAEPVNSGGTLAINTAANEPLIDSQVDQKNENNYRLILSFISIGEGTDYKTKEKFDAFLLDWQAKNNKQLQSESFAWGREGEVDICFRLNELSADKQVAFVSEAKNVVKDSKLVQITENQPCIHKR